MVIADVIVGIKANGTAVLHDLMHIYDKKITEDTVSMADNNDPQSTSNSSVKNTISQPTSGSQEADSGERETSRRKVTDADYMAAVERGDMDEAQWMVDEAAKAAGRGTNRPYASLTVEQIDYLIDDSGAGARTDYAPSWIVRALLKNITKHLVL